MKITTVINQKGGVGKTTLVFNLAKRSVEENLRTLVIDLDTQGNASQILTGDIGINRIFINGSDELFLPEFNGINPTKTAHGIDLVHGHKGIDRIDNVREVEELAYSATLRQRIRQLPYDRVIVDTPPAIGVRHMAPLYWSDQVVIPLEPELSSLAGLQDVIAAIDLARPLNPGLRWMAVLNRVKKASKSHREVVKAVEKMYGNAVVSELTDRVAVTDSRQQENPQPVWKFRGADKRLRELWHGFCSTIVC
ncbi:ParA family protein [Chromobacterium piscinae]|uniref:ParA family protein n=1 Tax=Chromobacterium piscinae TaxID=686831 RepID=UPI001E3C6962|nr:ParA family protein [Chromobacterium piscinae]MCD5327936.1 ParA family protein [Chromobacterium piscinae]